MKNNEFKLNPIGRFSNGNILLDAAYADGLLHLDKFSHAMVVFLRHDHINCSIFKLKLVDLKKGMIETEDSIIFDNCEIYDIKPYFPCEDRVRNCTAPDEVQTQISRICSGNIRSIGNIVRREGEYVLNLDQGDRLSNLKGCSHIRIFWWFDRFDKPEYRRATQCNPPYENAPRTGIFASRSPVRPNPIAMTTARILEIKENEIRVTGLDCLAGTPLIGILPYHPASDFVANVSVPAWLEHWPEWVDDRDYDTSDIVIKRSPLQDLRETHAHASPSAADLFQEHMILAGNQNVIAIRGARQNNLQGIDIDIPYQKITAVTGVSGSGKSSLAFDTVYTECKRRFLDVTGSHESNVGKPDFDSMQGVLPAVAVSQKSIGRNPRSTVGTITDMYDHLRVLFAAIGVRHCPDCGEPIIPMTVDEMVLLLADFHNVVIMTRSGEAIVADDLRSAVEKAVQLGAGAFWASWDGSEPLLLQTKQMCYHCHKIMFEHSPATFSFNNPESMCPVCNGYGAILAADADLIVTHPGISLLDGASPWWGKMRSFVKNPNHNWMKGEIVALAYDMGVDLELPWNQLPDDFKHQAIYGSDGRTVTLAFKNAKNGRNGHITRPVEGAYHSIKRLYAENAGDSIATAFMKQSICPRCNGERLNREARMVTVGSTRFPETVSMSISQLKVWCEQLPKQLSEAQRHTAVPVLQKLHHCLGGCLELGLGYLTLDRSIPTLSGGELQRLKLVAQLNSYISGVLYILDEPTAGLHPRDYEKLVTAIRRLRDHGNTVLLVEHNRNIIRIADHIIDIGPGAGADGGNLVFSGTLPAIMQSESSATGRYLSGQSRIFRPGHSDLAQSQWIKMSGIRYNNLKNVEVAIPTGAITCVTGVSGSGKSSLVKGVLFPSLANHLAGKQTNNHCDVLEGVEDFGSVVLADQSPIGRTPRSVPATYMGIMDQLRNLFAETAEAKAQGLTASHFSFNSPLGQCENCHGDGMTAAAFMDNVWVTCPVCNGKRYKSFVLDVKLDGITIFDVLSMNVSQAASFFPEHKKLAPILGTLIDVGLGYLKLGQNSATLSGGEAQRLKLAKNLCTSQRGKTLYLLDEPTTGLHDSDIQNLLLLLNKLAYQGHTIVIIEHKMNVIHCADWIVDLGPEGGDHGGQILAQGTPRDIARCTNSYTGQYL